MGRNADFIALHSGVGARDLRECLMLQLERAVADEKRGHMVALQSPRIVPIPLAEALHEPKRVDLEHDTVLTARATGISFGD